MRRSRVLLLSLVAGLLVLPVPAQASRALVTPGLPSGTGGDHPLKRYSVDLGNIDAFVTAIAYSSVTNPSGTFTVSGLPADATIRRALLYLTDWAPTGSAFGTFSNGSFGPESPFSLDPGGDLTLGTYRFDVTPFVYGNGLYDYTSSGIERTFGSALVVVYASPSLTRKVVEINDGGESMCCETFSVTQLFPGGPGGADGRLIIFTEADDAYSSGELIELDRVVVGGPIDSNLGPYASLFDIPVHFRPRHDSAAIYTPDDWFGWHLAVQVVGES